MSKKRLPNGRRFFAHQNSCCAVRGQRIKFQRDVILGSFTCGILTLRGCARDRRACALRADETGDEDMFHVLVAEDNENTRRLMETVLRRSGYEVYTAQDGEEALRVMDEHHIDIVLLDVMMPKVDGYAFTQELRENGVNTPILMITAKQMPADKHKGFLVGTDDYMTKPVDMEEMLLRIRALLRRAQIVSERKLTIGEVTLLYDSLTVTRGEDRQTLPQKEFYLLYKLLSYPDKIFTRIQLMDEIWGMESDSADTTVNVHINRLRRRFEDYPEFELVAVRGLGYKAVKKI